MEKKTIILALVLAVLLVGTVALILSEPSAPPTDDPSQAPIVFDIVINEISAKNESIFANNDGKYWDYIELYNAGSTISLEGFRLTDGKVQSPPLDFVLTAGEYRVIFLDDTLTGFSLGASGGDTIQLLDNQGNIVAQAITSTMAEDQVMLWQNGSYTLSYEASPGFANDAQGLSAFREGSVDGDPKLVISELLIGNVSSLPDENGVYCDVIELYNRSGEEITLKDYFLSDSVSARFRYRLPDVTVPAGGYCLIFCDSGNYVAESGQIHANFSLSQGETLTLTAAATGSYVTVTALSPADDRSLALSADGTYESSGVSLGYANDTAGMDSFAASRVDGNASLVINEVMLSSLGVPYNGGFRDVVEIINRSGETVSTKGWYLSDGGDPYEYALPEMELAPGQCLLIECSTGATGFALSEGEALRLSTPAYNYAPLVYCAKSTDGKTVSRQESGDEVSYCFMDPTLGYENTMENYLRYLRETQSKGLVISEMMSANNSYLKGAYATTCDWIELYNASDKDISLSDYYLTDDSGQLRKYPLPDQTLKAGKYCVILLSEEGKNLISGYPVLHFNLSSSGEKLYLSTADGVTDFVFLPALSADMSYGRPDGELTFSVLSEPTPKKVNSGIAQISEIPVATIPQGSYDDVQYLDISFTGSGKIYYTTDCTAPDMNAIPYTGPIRITETTVFRVICIEDGKQPSEILDLTYLLNENDTLGTVCIVTDPNNLWDYNTGIYVTGPGASDVEPYYGANYWKDWEKEATVSLFDTDGNGFYSGCGIKIFGGYSRVYAKKSLVCFFRSQYGAGQLEYPLFGEAGLDSYEAFVLRSGGQDVFLARMRDEVITSLASQHLGLPVQKYKPVVVYLNGEYFGLHYIREKISTHYVAGNFNVTADDVTLCVQAGKNSSSYQSLIRYAMNHDLSKQKYYDYVCERIDVDNYIDYIAAQMWIGNIDLGNVKFFKTSEHKWTWILFDTDLAFQNASNNTVKALLKTSGIGTNDIRSRTLAVRLMENSEFRDKFLTRLAWQINNVWTEENVIGRIDEIEEMIAADMEKDCDRWDKKYSNWEKNVEILRTYARKRNSYLLEDIQEFFDLTDSEMRDYGFPV